MVQSTKLLPYVQQLADAVHITNYSSLNTFIKKKKGTLLCCFHRHSLFSIIKHNHGSLAAVGRHPAAKPDDS